MPPSVDKPTVPAGGRFLLSAAAFVIVIAGMREAQSLLVPFLLSIFIAIVVAPAMSYLKAHRIPTALAILLIMLCIIAVGMLIGVSAIFAGFLRDFRSVLEGAQDEEE